jgi:hypothetical protein
MKTKIEMVNILRSEEKRLFSRVEFYERLSNESTDSNPTTRILERARAKWASVNDLLRMCEIKEDFSQEGQ